MSQQAQDPRQREEQGDHCGAGSQLTCKSSPTSVPRSGAERILTHTVSKSSCGFCPPNIVSSPERDRKSLGRMVITEAPLQGTELRGKAGAVRKPLMHPGDLGLGKDCHDGRLRAGQHGWEL